MDLHQPYHSFTIHASSGSARVGTLALPRGTVQTPVFMPVGTQASVKALSPDDLRDSGTEIILANTYHLMLRPGADTVKRLGGVSHFMRWDGPLLTDSGGYQVFSLASNRQITDDGVTFRSHLDGSKHQLTPERAMELQQMFGADVSMALDVLAGYDATALEQAEATRRTHEWLPRNIAAFRSMSQVTGFRGRLFGICQGGFNVEMRRRSAELVGASDVDGCAIGGLSVGEPKDVMQEMLHASIQALPRDRPRYLMGVGSPEDVWRGVAAGVDMFDCVLPTRVARRGALFTPYGRVNVTAARFRELEEPIDVTCDCYTCRTFSAAYLHHLFRAGELLAHRLASLHNVRFMHRQMETMRSAIVAGRFEEAHARFALTYQPANQEVAAVQRARYRARVQRP